ncbi:hypothetical protein J6590_000496 [Homalodisca vitripennis]|nr:hypothetical protein J6590_000496 [Homalodisca vitripennis]
MELDKELIKNQLLKRVQIKTFSIATKQKIKNCLDDAEKTRVEAQPDELDNGKP